MWALACRRVRVRVISDNETALNEGSDVMKLAEAGVATVVDCDLPSPPRTGGKGRQPPPRAQPHGCASDDGGIKRHMHNKVRAHQRCPALPLPSASPNAELPLTADS